MSEQNTTTTTAEPEYKWAHPLEWFRDKVNEHRDDPAWLADCITSLTAGMDGDTIQDLFQSEMIADGYFQAEESVSCARCANVEQLGGEITES